MADKGEQSIGLVDEILEQQTTAALKLSHIDENIEELRQAVLRMGGEIGALAMTNAAAAPSGKPDHAVDSLEREVGSLKSRLGLVTGVMGLQTLLLIALLVFAFKPMSSAPSPAELPASAPPVATTPPPAATGAIDNPFGGATGQATEEEKPVEKVEKPTKKKKKK